MIVLAIGSDRSIFVPNSASAVRQIAYGAQFDELHIIVFSKATQLDQFALAPNVHIYPTASRHRLLYGFHALRIAAQITKPDIVTVQDPFESGLVGWMIARTRGAALHVQVHTDLCASEFRGLLLNRLRLLIARFICARADRIRVVSNNIKAGIEKKYAPRAPISVLPIFVDITKFRSAHAGILAGRFQSFNTKLLVVARLEKEKNVMLALKSFAAVAPADACLIILGDGREKKRLEDHATMLGVASRVFFEGTTDPLPYYALADLILVPSQFEGYGLVIIEALAAGKPVIATDVGIAREAGAIVTDSAHFAESLTQWFENGSRIGQLQNYPYRSFEEYVESYAADIKATTVQS